MRDWCLVAVIVLLVVFLAGITCYEGLSWIAGDQPIPFVQRQPPFILKSD